MPWCFTPGFLMRQPKDVFVWSILFRRWRTSHLGYPSRLSFGFPPFSMEIKRWFVFGSHPLCPGCSHFSKVQRDSSRPFALCTRRCVEDASFMSDLMSKRSTKVLHETQDSPIRWDRSVRAIKVGNGRFYT